MKNRLVFPLFSLLLVSLLFSLNAFSQNTQDTVVRVAPHALNQDSDPRIVDIVIENGQNVAGYQVKLQFDSYFMKYAEIDHGDYLPKAVFSGEPQIIDIDPNDPKNTLKVILFAATSIAGAGNGNGVLATLKFNRENSGASDLTLLDETLLSNRAGEPSFPRLEDSRTHLNGVADLTVESVQAKSQNTTAREQYHYNKGEEFELHVTVRNIGNWKSASPQLQLYGPTGIVAEKGEPLEPSVNIEQLEPNRAVDISLPVAALEAAGVYYYTVCIEGYEGWNRAGKNVKDNNCYTLEITAEEGPPDLIVESVEAYSIIYGPTASGPANRGPVISEVFPRQEFEFSATVKNRGLEESAMTLLRYYRFTDEDISTASKDDELLEAILIHPLSADSTFTKSISVPAPKTPGIYYYGACVDGVEGELETGNNCSGTVEIKVEGPDVGIGLEITDGLITYVALGKDVTYFVLNPQVARGKDKERYYNEQTTITLNIPGTKSYNREKPLTDLLDELPKEYPYFMFPLETPRERQEEIEDATNAAKGEVIKDTIGFIVDATSFALEFIPGVGEAKEGWKFAVRAWNLTRSISSLISSAGGTIRDWAELSPQEKELVNSFLALFEPPKVTMYGNVVEDDISRFLLMIPKRLESIEITEKHSYKPDPSSTKIYYYENEQMRIEFFGFTTDGTKQIDLIPKKTPDKRVTVEINIINPTLYHHLLQAYLIHLSSQRLSDEELKILKNIVEKFEEFKHKGINELLELEILNCVDLENLDCGNLNIENKYVLDLKNSTGAAPRARPISLADYPPFQQLSPEIQEYLLQYFEGHANPETINTETWQMPKETILLPNYPNPFNPETWIPYQLANPADVALTIYDIQGRIVRDLDLGHQRAGVYQSRARAAHWDGRNAHGEPVASGLYFYTLKAGDFTATRKMLIRK